MTAPEIINILETTKSNVSQMDELHLKNLINILLSTQRTKRCVFFEFLSLQQIVDCLIRQLLSSDDLLSDLNHKQIKSIYRILGDYNYYPCCACCNQIIKISSETHNYRRIPDSPQSFTWDHIFPQSLGGATTLGNLQPTHKICNNKKADDVLYETIPDIKIDLLYGDKCVTPKHKVLYPSFCVYAR